MALSDPITIRLQEHKRQEYADQAAARGTTIGPYLRDRLERDDATREEIADLRGLMIELLREFDQVRQNVGRAGGGGQSSPEAGAPATDAGMTLELLLLLRSMVPQDKANMVQREVERQGLTVWTGKKGAQK